MGQIVTPAVVEKRLIDLSKELDTSYEELVAAEHLYHQAKGQYEVQIASARLRVGKEFAAQGVKATVGEREDMATTAAATELFALYTAEAVVKAARANAQRIRTQIDIARSVGTSVRTSMEV
jgi:hypothetical protein